MRPSFYPKLINGPFEDPGLFIPFQFQRRALLFDLGNIQALFPRDVLKISHVFITHTHMDHFIGFDTLLRIFLGREKTLHLFGPHGFLDQIQGKLSAYSWDLVSNYLNRFDIFATEVRSDSFVTCKYRCQNGFLPGRREIEPFEKVIYKEPGFTVEAAILDHSIACLGFSITERFHVNILKDALVSMDLQIGPWLKEFKDALFREDDPSKRFEVQMGKTKRVFILGELADRIARITPGQKITYISDISYHRANLEKVLKLAQHSDQLFIEGPFLDSHKGIAQTKHHLTAGQAGKIAAKAGVKQFTIFHFSPRYTGMGHLLKKEAADAYEKALKNRLSD